MMQLVLANMLLAHAPLSTLVDNRIHWDEMPQELPVPNVLMLVVSGVTDYTMKGPSGYAMTRVQLDARGKSADEARVVADAIKGRLSGFSGQFENYKFQGCFLQGQRTSSQGSGPLAWFTDSRDYTIHWAPA